MKKIFLSFADARMSRALKRIHDQALSMRVYDQIVIANEFSLDLKFREKYRNILTPKIRGFGYWIWKAQIISQTLDQMCDGDILQYTDAGCHLNPSGRSRLVEYFELAAKSGSGILGFQAVPPVFHDCKIKLHDLSEYKWCKGDLCDHFDVRNNSSIMNTQTIGAGVVFIKKCPKAIDFVRSWLSVFEHDIHLADDTLSKSSNIEGFIEHRHDQSIFSILGKLNKIDTVSAYEYWYPHNLIPLLPNWKILKDYPIHAKRDKGVHFMLKPYYLTIRIFSRIKFEMKKKRL